MRADFHYCAVFVAATRAGYSQQDACTIAHASQYVDDNTKAEPEKAEGGILLTERTARSWFKLVFKASDPAVQATYVIFHHLPRDFALWLVKAALLEPGPYGLMRLGVALHGYADTFAHDGFSGRWEAANKCEDLWIDGEHVIYPSIAYPLSHAQLGFVPDLPWANWRAQMCGGRMLGRDNRIVFEEALIRIAGLLGGSLSAADSAKIRELFRLVERDDDRCAAWQEAFNIPEYDPKNIERRGGAHVLSTPWALFHRAVREQRCLVCGTYGLL
jgi:hypothetical protein